MQMRSGVSVLVVVILWTAALPAAEPSDAAIEDILRKTCDSWHAPGIAAAVVRDEKIVYLSGVGVRELGSDKPVTADTLFAIGSCTKAFTATAFALLVEEGKADWDDPVRKHLPWFRLDDPLADRDVRLCDLLCHRIGLASHDMLWYGAPWSIEESVRRMAFLQRSSSFRSKYEYNNLAYLAAGLAIREMAKEPWHLFVGERLFKPLQMKNAVFTSGEAQNQPDHASPHGHDANDKVTVIPWYNDDKQIRASGSIKASVHDMSKWLRVQLAHGKLDEKQVVSAAALEETHTPRIPVPLSAADRAAGATQASYALGWHISDYRGHAIHQHGGAVAGFRARILLVPRKKLGLVLLTNLEDMEIVQAAGNSLLDHLLGLEKKDWNAFFHTEHDKTKATEKARLDKFLGGRVPGTKAKDLVLYVGTYSEPAYGTVKIARKERQLLLEWSSYSFALTHFHYDTFLTPKENLPLPAALRAQPVVFEMNEDAEMSVLRFLGRKFTRHKGTKAER
ncbi:MAG TPA: serine hydrolase [Gemmataceae bacterium]|jgi:CubicO group peptidase (beta-lactamase class C family)